MKLITLFLIVLCLTGLKAQTSIRTGIAIKIDTVSVPKYKIAYDDASGFKTIRINVNFGDFVLEDNKEIEVLNNSVIKSIDLVYTKYPVGEDFTLLNRRRIEYLHLMCPSIFNNKMTEWRIVAQTDCKNESAARHHFHGFVITYKPGPTAESAALESRCIKDVWMNRRKLEDSTVYKIFARNKWKNMTVAADFTGSMAPYISQVLLWYKLTFATKDFSEFIFFNDGDQTSDEKKRTGKTGGIYYCKSTNKDTVLNTAYRCTRNGYGGDLQENNVEACLFAISQNPHLKEIVMVADNWAPMRDFVMASQITVPVHVVICGVLPEIGINTEYLDLARRTGGSIHTMEDDITDLAKIAEGKSVVIDGTEYRIIGGRFVKVARV